MRAYHGNTAVLEEIQKRFGHCWDDVFEPKKEDHDDEDGPFKPRIYFRGLFTPNGDANFSVHAIVLNLFFVAAGVVFSKHDGRSWGRAWEKSTRFMQRNLFDILMFAENPTDSLRDSILRVFEEGCGVHYDAKKHRAERIASMASCIYGWILRESRPWWKHPRWHIHHWKIQVPQWQLARRWLFDRCAKCGGRFKWGQSAIGHQWDPPPPRPFRSQQGICHDTPECGGRNVAIQAGDIPPPPAGTDNAHENFSV